MQNEIAFFALRCSVVSFGLYTVLILAPLFSKIGDAQADNKGGKRDGETFAPTSVPEVSALVTALATLAEALAKAGPALWSLIGSILFLLIAAMAAGVLV